jgi:predicted SnoaL-like aldol condensation-catalyzing enzyme
MPGNPETNKQRVREIFDRIINGGDIELADAYYRDDYIQHNPLVAQGRAGLKALLAHMHGSPDPMRAEIVLIDAVDDRVWVMLDWSGGGRAPGAPALQRSVEVFRVEDGLMAEHWDCIQIGPEPG